MIEHWLKTFMDDPRLAVQVLMSGRAGLGTELRLDTPELLHHLFAEGSRMSGERSRLDVAIYDWLSEARRDYLQLVRRLGFASYGRRIVDALVALQLLELPYARECIRSDFDTWMRWLTPLRLSPERDPALECLRLMADGQGDRGFAAMWMRQATDPRPEYLNVALIGLERLPTDGRVEINRALMLRALLDHAVRRRGAAEAAEAFFNQRFAVLRGLGGAFPGRPQDWRNVLADCLYSFRPRSEQIKAVALKNLIQNRQNNTSKKSLKKREITYRPIHLSVIDALQADIQRNTGDADRHARRLFDILEVNFRFAQQTGENSNFVRTLSRIGNVLLEGQNLSASSMNQLKIEIERALSLEPMDPYCWMLCADWFGAQEQDQAREWILREAARLFPNNGHSRVELARLLVDRGEAHWDEAESWLREVADFSPNNEVSRVELARLLIRRGEAHWDEAESWLRKAADFSRNNEVSRVELARLLIRRGEAHWDEAESWLRKVAEFSRNNEVSRVELARLLIRRGEAHWDEAESWLREVADSNRNSEVSRVVLAALLIRLQREREALDLIDLILDRNPKHLIANELREHLTGETNIDAHSFDAWLEVEDDLYAADDLAKSFGAPKSGISLKSDLAAAIDPIDVETFALRVIADAPSHGEPPASQDKGPVGSQASLVGNAPDGVGDRGIARRPETVKLSFESLNNSRYDEIMRRGGLCAEFRMAQISAGLNVALKTDLIRSEALQDDPLAGLFLQWLVPNEAPEPPPNAWAWNACRLWQEKARGDEWDILEQRSSELSAETSFLSWFAKTANDEQERVRWLGRFSDQDSASSPSRHKLMIENINNHDFADVSKSNEVVMAILSSAALPPPMFASLL